MTQKLVSAWIGLNFIMDLLCGDCGVGQKEKPMTLPSKLADCLSVRRTSESGESQAKQMKAQRRSLFLASPKNRSTKQKQLPNCEICGHFNLLLCFCMHFFHLSCTPKLTNEPKYTSSLKYSSPVKPKKNECDSVIFNRSVGDYILGTLWRVAHKMQCQSNARCRKLMETNNVYAKDDEQEMQLCLRQKKHTRLHNLEKINTIIVRLMRATIKYHSPKTTKPNQWHDVFFFSFFFFFHLIFDVWPLIMCEPVGQ